MRDINQISAQIIDAAMKVHSALGQGCWKWPTKVVCCMREPSASLRALSGEAGDFCC
jgi:hypothetical protein